MAKLVNDSEYEVWIANQVGEVAAEFGRTHLVTEFSFHECFNFLCDEFGLTNDTHIARAIGGSSNSVINWKRVKSIPRLRMTLNICWVFGVSLLQFIRKELPKNHDSKLRPSREPLARHVTTSKRRPVDRTDLERKLTRIVVENRYPLLAFATICEKYLKRHEVVVRELYPELARQISQRYLTNRRMMAEVRQAQFCNNLKLIARLLHSKGIVPNHKTLKPYIDGASKLRCAWAIEALREVRIELGYESTEEQLLLPV